MSNNERNLGTPGSHLGGEEPGTLAIWREMTIEGIDGWGGIEYIKVS